ncbi:Zn-ribbon domain-containing OB-fold protein [soil metagenome]
MMAWDTDPYVQAYPEIQPFWEAAAQGRLLVRTCEACGRAFWYPRALCPLCGSLRTGWMAASGRGTLFAFSEMRKAEVPYILAYVELAEGPRLMTNMIDCTFERLRIGMPVTVRFMAATEGRAVPAFTPGP